ncbi:MAG: sulfurtransferase [Pseudolysinimonas sp.]|uniref:sulfurtransferase n=1 Tax=Pseudolysinimonas sp. TaxID=2680009 RepID=UPI0032653C98
MSILITVDELARELESDAPPIVLDVRWRLDRRDGRPEYLAGHLPGARFVDLDAQLAAHGEPSEGRHPLPDRERLQEAARSWGINEGDAVVVYDDLANQSAARAWWLLSYAGIADVRLLDGALAAWTRSGRELESGEAVSTRGDVVLDFGHLPTIDIDGAASFPSHGTLLDARAGERYRGEVEPVDPRAGHIPGAISAPTAANVDAEGHFLSAEALRARFSDVGVDASDEVAVYCGSGVTAAHEIAALTIAGFRPSLYAGSWSQWSNHPDRPVAVGQ